MTLTSTAFTQDGYIPKKYSYRDENISPPLVFNNVPSNTKSLALVCHDPDAPMDNGFTHWIVWNIPPHTEEIKEGEVPKGANQGLTDWGKNVWGGPMPPSGTHHYNFYLYALDKELILPTNTNRSLLEQAIDGHVIQSAKLVGLFSA